MPEHRSESGTTLAAAFDPEADPIKAANLALRLIETADPPSQTTLEVSGAMGVDQLSLGQPIALAEERGISLEREGSTPLPAPDTAQ